MKRIGMLVLALMLVLVGFAAPAQATGGLVGKGEEVLGGGYICEPTGAGTYKVTPVKTLNDLVRHAGHTGDMSRDYMVGATPISKLEHILPNTTEGKAIWLDGCAVPKQDVVVDPGQPQLVCPAAGDTVSTTSFVALPGEKTTLRTSETEYASFELDAGFGDHNVTAVAKDGYTFAGGDTVHWTFTTQMRMDHYNNPENGCVKKETPVVEPTTPPVVPEPTSPPADGGTTEPETPVDAPSEEPTDAPSDKPVTEKPAPGYSEAVPCPGEVIDGKCMAGTPTLDTREKCEAAGYRWQSGGWCFTHKVNNPPTSAPAPAPAPAPVETATPAPSVTPTAQAVDAPVKAAEEQGELAQTGAKMSLLWLAVGLVALGVLGLIGSRILARRK